MEPGIMIAVFISCGVAVGAGIFVAIQGSKQNEKCDKDDSD
jgi:hypothetical protein